MVGSRALNDWANHYGPPCRSILTMINHNLFILVISEFENSCLKLGIFWQFDGTLCLKFELTLKKMLRRFRRHQNLNFEISYWFSKYFWNWTTSSWENSVFAKIYLITNQTFKDIGTLKKCSRTFDGISKIVWS